MKVLIVHGSFGNPSENWFPWLKKELEKLGCSVTVPTFPTPEGQNLISWLKVIEDYPFDEETIVIGHSLAPAFLLSVLEKSTVKAAFFVASFNASLGNPEFDEVNNTFVHLPFDWKAIRSHSSSFHVYHSDNDPYVPLELGEEVANDLEVELTLVKGAGHFNSSSGYTEFPLLLEDIKNEL